MHINYFTSLYVLKKNKTDKKIKNKINNIFSNQTYQEKKPFLYDRFLIFKRFP